MGRFDIYGIHKSDLQTLNSFNCIRLLLSSNLIIKLLEFNLQNISRLAFSGNPFTSKYHYIKIADELPDIKLDIAIEWLNLIL